MPGTTTTSYAKSMGLVVALTKALGSLGLKYNVSTKRVSRKQRDAPLWTDPLQEKKRQDTRERNYRHTPPKKLGGPDLKFLRLIGSFSRRHLCAMRCVPFPSACCVALAKCSSYWIVPKSATLAVSRSTLAMVAGLSALT